MQVPVIAAIAVLDRLKEWLVALGPLGAFAIALVDSFIPLPGGADLAVIILSLRSPQMAIATVLAATAGSAIGATILYLGARKAGEKVLARFNPAKRERVENLLGRFDVLTIAVASMLPPPFPFKIFNLSAGVLNVKVVRFVVAIALGRLVRFSIEALLAFHYGEAAIDVIKRNGLLIVVPVLVIAAAVLAWKAWSSKRAVAQE